MSNKMVVSEGLAFFPREIQYIRLVPVGINNKSIQVGFKNRDMVHYVTNVPKDQANEMFSQLVLLVENASEIPLDQAKNKVLIYSEPVPEIVI